MTCVLMLVTKTCPNVFKFFKDYYRVQIGIFMTNRGMQIYCMQKKSPHEDHSMVKV